MDYHPEIQKAIDEIEKDRTNVVDYQTVMETAAQLIEKFGAVENTKNWRLSFGYGDGCLNGALVHVDVTDLGTLTEVRRWIRKQGFGDPKVEDYEVIGRRSWTYKDDKGRLLVLSGFFPAPGWHEDTAAKCQFVKVGVKEEPIYELQCNGVKVSEEEEK